jgi:hypothetical protein
VNSLGKRRFASQDSQLAVWMDSLRKRFQIADLGTGRESAKLPKGVGPREPCGVRDPCRKNRVL